MAGIDANTVFCSHFDGANTATAATDSSYAGAGSPHTITFVGTAQLATAQKKFGTASLLLDGNSDYLTMPDSDDWDIGVSSADNWTIDCWVKHVNTSGLQCYAGSRGGAEAREGFIFAHNESQGIGFSIRNTADSEIVTVAYGGEITDTNWHHVAMCKVANKYSTYLDGAQVGYVESSNTTTLSNPLAIGVLRHNAATALMNGYIDEFRIQKNNYFGATPVVGLTDTITVPTLAYSRDAIRSHAIIL